MMREKKYAYLSRIAARLPGDIGRARREAQKEGINLDVVNGWESPTDVPNCFGPDPEKDNVYLNSPSLVLHALDEGLIEKFDAGTVRWAIHDGAAQHGYAATEVTRMIDNAFAATYNERPLNSNVEVNGRDAFQLFPHGVVGYLLDKRRLNAKWYGPLTDQLQMYLMGSDLLTPAHKKEMADLAHMVRQIHFMVRQPVKKKNGVEQYQAYLNTFVTKLIAYNKFHTPSECRSIKYHCARHWGEHRKQLGCSAVEYSLERALGDHFTRFWGLTNHGRHGQGKDMQLAAIVHRHQVVADLCYHAGIASSLRQGTNTVDETSDEVLQRTTTVTLTGRRHIISPNGDTRFEYESVAVQRVFRGKLRENYHHMVMPVVVSNTLRIPLQNRSVERGNVNRVEVITLRARPLFFGKKRYDNLKLLVKIAPLPCGRDTEIAFGRCVAFYRDCRGEHYVGVHWYEQIGNKMIDEKARLAKVRPMKPGLYSSYDVMPVGAILNGALLVQDRGIKQRLQDPPQYWVRQSPREYNYLLDFVGQRTFVAGESQLSRDGLIIPTRFNSLRLQPGRPPASD